MTKQPSPPREDDRDAQPAPSEPVPEASSADDTRVWLMSWDAALVRD